jgi:hypothetical protein
MAINLSDQWIAQSDQLLKSLRELKSKPDKDRLEIISSIFFILNTLERSVKGWRRWIENLDFMARFSEEELSELEDGLFETGQAFLQYDIDLTKKYQEKTPTVEATIPTQRTKVDTRGLFA